MAKLTVSMPAYNAAKYIKQAMDSVLSQQDIDLELIVVNDGSTDETATIVGRYQDQRVRLLQNREQRGIGYCHNLVLRESRSPFIAHVDADDFIMPGALRKMVAALEDNPSAGQAHCHFFDVDANGSTSRNAFYDRWTQFRKNRTAKLDYKTNLIKGITVINHLRTYRTGVLRQLGGFNEKIRFSVDYEMALRLIDRYTIKLVPDFLYCHRIHGDGTTESLRFKTFRFWVQMYRIRRELLAQNKIHFVDDANFNLHRLIQQLMASRVEKLKQLRTELVKQAGVYLKWRLWAPLGAQVYRVITNGLAGWPLAWRGAGPRLQPSGEKRIAYYLWFFPILSETFIQREITALRRAGLVVEVLAHEAQNQNFLNEDAKRLMEETHYIKPIDDEKMPQFLRSFFRRCPFTVINLFLHVLFCKYDVRKSFGRDIGVFKRAICLAGILSEKKIDHVHAPWASLDAFVAQLAARLLKIPDRKS